MSTVLTNESEQLCQVEKFIIGHPMGCLMQSPRWAKVKPNWDSCTVLSKDETGRLRGSMLILILPDKGDGTALLYAPRGPVCDPHDGQAVKELIDGARQLAAKYPHGVFKCDPLVLEDDAEAIAVFLAQGLAFTPGAKFHHTVQPRLNAVRHGLTGMTENSLIMSFAAKPRWYIRSSIKQGVVCKNGTVEDLPAFYEIYANMGQNKDFNVRPMGYLKGLLEAFGEDGRLLLCYSKEGELLAGAIAVVAGDRVTYVYGALDRKHPELAASYLLQWEMLRFALQRGCDAFDMGGICLDPEEDQALYDLWTFKHKFAPAEALAGEFVFEF